MKKLIITICILLLSQLAYANDVDKAVEEIKAKVGWSIGTRYLKSVSPAGEFVQSLDGYSHRLKAETVFIEITKLALERKASGQRLDQLDVLEVTIGAEKQFLNNFSFWLSGGVAFFQGDGKVHEFPDTVTEAWNRWYWNERRYANECYIWDYVEEEFSTAPVVNIGVDYNIKLYKSLFLKTGIQYSWLRPKVHRRFYNKDGKGGNTKEDERHDYIEREVLDTMYWTFGIEYRHTKKTIISFLPSYDLENGGTVAEVKLTRRF